MWGGVWPLDVRYFLSFVVRRVSMLGVFRSAFQVGTSHDILSSEFQVILMIPTFPFFQHGNQWSRGRSARPLLGHLVGTRRPGMHGGGLLRSAAPKDPPSICWRCPSDRPLGLCDPVTTLSWFREIPNKTKTLLSRSRLVFSHSLLLNPHLKFVFRTEYGHVQNSEETRTIETLGSN